jgi:DNA uptake protein ComE-like DNA-binding protein
MNANRIALAAALVLACAGSADAQVAKGLVDPNVATEKELLALPHVTPAIVKSVLEKRPFLSVTEFDTFLGAQGLTAEQRTALYGKAFVQVNLNTASSEEILLIPGAGKRMAREFAEYRPWTSYAQFDKEIGKYTSTRPRSRG